MDLPSLGIDIAKRKFDVTLLIGSKAKNKVCDNTPKGFDELLGWLSRQGVAQVHACMEATGAFSEPLALALADAGHTVSMVNPARIKGFARSELIRTKNDRTDAGLIARFCLAMRPTAWKAPAPESRELQALVRRLDALQDMLQQERNRLKSGVSSELVAQSTQDVLRVLEQAATAIEQNIRNHFEQHAELKAQRDLLVTIPGIAEKTAAVILAELPTLTHFDKAKQVAAFSGLTPHEHTSGSSIRSRSAISKVGSARLRKALYFPAINAKRFSPVFQAWAKRLEDRGKAPKAIVVATMRKLLHVAYGVLKSGTPFDPTRVSMA